MVNAKYKPTTVLVSTRDIKIEEAKSMTWVFRRGAEKQGASVWKNFDGEALQNGFLLHFSGVWAAMVWKTKKDNSKEAENL